MPEAPEVEAIARNLDHRLSGMTIDKLAVYSISALKTAVPPASGLHGQTIRGVFRRGKFLIIDAELLLAAHLARAGWIRWSDELKPPAKISGRNPLAAQLFLSNGSGLGFTEQGTQKRLSLYVVATAEDVPGIDRLGPDVLSNTFSIDILRAALAQGGHVKSVLSDQSRIAGIGNAYSDEILHAAQMSPFAPAKSISPQQVETLFTCTREIINDAVARADGLELTDLKDDKRSNMRVHRREGLPCPICGTAIRSVHFATRSLQYCPGCQTGGKPLADRRLSRLLK